MNEYYDVSLKEFRLNELKQYATFSFIRGDISDKKLIQEIFEKYTPSIVVNLAHKQGCGIQSQIRMRIYHLMC